MAGSSIGTGLRKWAPSKLATAHIIADALFTAVARISMEDAEVLTLVSEIVRDASNGERRLDEHETAELLLALADGVDNIRDRG